MNCYIIDGSLMTVERRETTHSLLRSAGDRTRWISNELLEHLCPADALQLRAGMKALCLRREPCVTEKLGRVYDARDTARDAISQWDGEDLQDLRAALEDCVNDVREVADEYNESADNIEQSFPNGNPTSEDCREKADELSSWCDEMEGADFEEIDEEDDDDEKRSECAEAQREAALGVVDACPV